MAGVPLSRWVVFSALAIGGCLLDLVTKSAIFARLGMPGGEVIWIFEPILGMRTSLNEGALFGIGQGWGTAFAALSVAAATFVLYLLFYLGEARSWELTIALGCVTAGIFGNLYDRLGLHYLKWHVPPVEGHPVYAVRDWIHFTVGSFEWPTFNIADSLLVCGAGVLLLHAWRGGPPGSESADNAASDAAPSNAAD